MPGPAVEILQQFGAVEDDQRYTRLVDLFADDAVYYDPFFGAQRGKAAIQTFMEHMEEMVPKSGATFASWHTEADTDCGWAQWDMVAPNADGEPTPVPGQSLYRLRDGKVTFVADYLDTRAYRKLRGADAKTPDHATSIGLSAPEPSDQMFPRDLDPGKHLDAAADDPHLGVLRDFWRIQGDANYGALVDLFTDDARFVDPLYGEMNGRAEIAAFFDRMETEMPAMNASFEVADMAADATVGWSQWWCRFPNGVVPGWTLHTFRDGRISLDSDHFDQRVARELTASQ